MAQEVNTSVCKEVEAIVTLASTASGAAHLCDTSMKALCRVLAACAGLAADGSQRLGKLLKAWGATLGARRASEDTKL